MQWGVLGEVEHVGEMEGLEEDEEEEASGEEEMRAAGHGDCYTTSCAFARRGGGSSEPMKPRGLFAWGAYPVRSVFVASFW